MWRALLILIITIGILGGGFYYFADHEGWFDRETALNSEETDSQALVTATDLPIVENPWLDYQYQANGVRFSTKYPAENWKVVEQLNANELTIIFTNNDSCQVLYLFDIRQGQYKTELSNNNNSDACAEVLRKVVSIATIPQFGVLVDESTENPSTTNVADAQDDEPSSVSSVNDEKENDLVVDEESAESTEEETDEPEKSVGPALPNTISEGVPDQELLEMTAKERYDTAKEFVNNYLLEYAKRRWATIETLLSVKAKAELGGKTLSTVATPFYYYELLTILKEIEVGHFQANVKLTDKEEQVIGSSEGIYTLNIVWEYGEWKIDNYLFQ